MNLTIDRYYLYVLILDIIFLIWGLLCGASFILTLALIIWIDMMLYSYKKIEQRSILFAFGVAFFMFLMSREFLQQFLGYKKEDFSNDLNNHLYICLFLALSALWFSYILFSRKTEKRRAATADDARTSYAESVRKVAKMVFYCTLPFALAYRIIVSSYVSLNGYTDYYTDYASTLSGNTVLYVISKVELIMPVAFAIIMASLPTKKELKGPFYFYILYLILSLGSGQRSTFMLGIFLIFVFAVYMQGLYPEEGWFERKYILYLAAFIPVLAVAGTVINVTRFGGTTSDMNVFDSFMDFFYDQGVTGNVVKRAYQYSDKIPDSVYTLEFLHSGLLARLLGIKVYNGNSVEHALYGNSMTHALGYAVLGSQYLAGRGTGSSYIIELFFDFGYMGVVAGNVLYAWIFTKITRINRNNVLTRSLVFSVITQLLWAPRASFTAFISFLDAPSTIAAFIFIFGIGNLLNRKFEYLNEQGMRDNG
jgi:oligosaccharide repeat unit polymerase